MKSTISNLLLSLASKAFDLEAFSLSWVLTQWSLYCDVENFYAWFLRGNLLLEVYNSPAKALEVFNALDNCFTPASDEVKLCKGFCFWDLGQFESALVQFLSARELYASLESNYHIAAYYVLSEEYSLAKELIRDILQKDPEYAAAKNLQAILEEHLL